MRFARGLLAALATALLLLGVTSCGGPVVIGPANSTPRLRDLAMGPGTQETVNSMPHAQPLDTTHLKPVALTVAHPGAKGPAGKPLDAHQREADAAKAYLHDHSRSVRVLCRAIDPVTRQPLQVLVRAECAGRTAEAVTDPVSGLALIVLPAGHLHLYAAGGAFLTPYATDVQLPPGDFTLNLLLTRVSDLLPANIGFATLAFARSPDQDWTSARDLCACGQSDFYFLLGAPPVGGKAAPAEPMFVDGPCGAIGSRFAGIGAGAPPVLATAAYPTALPDLPATAATAATSVTAAGTQTAPGAATAATRGDLHPAKSGADRAGATGAS
ncbi:MAG: hypothetical protein ACREJ2_06275, partial [Planctomycetota bacterium]